MTKFTEYKIERKTITVKGREVKRWTVIGFRAGAWESFGHLNPCPRANATDERLRSLAGLKDVTVPVNIVR